MIFPILRLNLCEGCYPSLTHKSPLQDNSLVAIQFFKFCEAPFLSPSKLMVLYLIIGVITSPSLACLERRNQKHGNRKKMHEWSVCVVVKQRKGKTWEITRAPFGLEESHRNFGGSNSGGKETRDAVCNKGSFPAVSEERKLLTHKTQERENPLWPKGTEGTLRSLSRLSRHGLSSSRHCLSPSCHGLIPSHTRARGRARRPPTRSLRQMTNPWLHWKMWRFKFISCNSNDP